MKTGSLTITDLLANNQTTARAFGMDTIIEVIRRDLETHNRLIDQAVSQFAEVSTDSLRMYGTSDNGEMQELDENGRATTQKITGGVNCGFPLRKYGYAFGGTRDFLEAATPRDIARRVIAAEKAHAKGVMRGLKRAVYTATNSTFTDRLQAPVVALPVRAFVNADSNDIPEGPNGQAFDGSSHTHYLGAASLSASTLLSLHDTVLEHGLGVSGKLVLVISATDRTAVEALTGFRAYPDPRVTYRATDTNTATIDLVKMDDLAIGTFHAAEVWVKPWAIANYVAALVLDADEKPLVMRTRPGGSNLKLDAQIEAQPLQAEYATAHYGFGVWNRTAGGVLYFANATYASPTIS
ncbi:MAG TPA: hypothetical protein VFS11_05850 [Gemmatimonadales bacterium]|nr:hypothetical protein [Gemmatimonadales bacterium]